MSKELRDLINRKFWTAGESFNQKVEEVIEYVEKVNPVSSFKLRKIAELEEEIRRDSYAPKFIAGLQSAIEILKQP